MDSSLQTKAASGYLPIEQEPNTNHLMYCKKCVENKNVLRQQTLLWLFLVFWLGVAVKTVVSTNTIPYFGSFGEGFKTDFGWFYLFILFFFFLTNLVKKTTLTISLI
jgi:hypothetical protein